jgi:hypothetical protein
MPSFGGGTWWTRWGCILRCALLKAKKRVRFSTYFEHFDFDRLPEGGVIAQSVEYSWTLLETAGDDCEGRLAAKRAVYAHGIFSTGER